MRKTKKLKFTIVFELNTEEDISNIDIQEVIYKTKYLLEKNFQFNLNAIYSDIQSENDYDLNHG